MKCRHQEGDITSLFGIAVDPCRYKLVEGYRNVNVYIGKCERCGAIDIRWERTPLTVKIPADELGK